MTEEESKLSQQPDGEVDMETTGEEESSSSGVISVHVLSFLKDLHQKHGLRHNDYQRYRGYCSRRLLRLRQAVKLVQGEKKKFIKKEVDLEILKTDKHLMIPLISAERGWAYAMGLKFQLNTEPRKKYHMINRLRKAKVYADQLLHLAMECPLVDARTKLECQAYGAWMTGNLHFETTDWKEAMEAFNQARSIYEKLSVTLGEEEGALYKAKMDELVPNLRYCAYNIGDTSAKKDLMNLRGAKGNLDLDDLINQTREQQAATLQEVEWRGRKMAVKQEKVRIFLLRNQEFDEELKSLETSEEKISAYESLMMDCKDAIQVLRDDLVEDPNFRNRQQVKEGSVTASHFLYTYLNYIKYHKVIERNLVMIDSMKAVLNGQVQVAPGRKPVKCQDLVRIYENIVSNLGELPVLAGLEEDLAFRQGIDAQIGFYKGLRCYYIAQSFLGAQKWPEAMALFQRATAYANKAKNDSDLDQKFKKEATDLIKAIEGRQFMAHANSILDNESVADKMDKMTLNDLSSKVLTDRLDVYFEDDNLTKNPKLAHFPPQFQAIPCKPLFFDLALEHVEFPSLESKLASPNSPQKQGGQTGWLGGWLGWGSKK